MRGLSAISSRTAFATASRKNIFLVVTGELSTIGQHVSSVGIGRSIGEGEGFGGACDRFPFQRLDVGFGKTEARDLTADRAMRPQFGELFARAGLSCRRRMRPHPDRDTLDERRTLARANEACGFAQRACRAFDVEAV